MIVRTNAILNQTLVTVNDFIGRLYESHYKQSQNNLCNDAQKVHYDSFCHRQNSVVKITTRYLKQENLPFLRPERKYPLHRQIRFLSGACCSINKQFSQLSSCLLSVNCPITGHVCQTDHFLIRDSAVSDYRCSVRHFP